MTKPLEKPAPLGSNENRKASKPLIEKRRRARINSSLAELKSIVVGSVTLNNCPNGKPPKLEKADILEMTVHHLKKIHHEINKVPDDEKYMAGFQCCMKEVRNFLESNADEDSKSRLLNYLNSFSNRMMISANNHISSSDLETGMDDSSCSSNSRSETPSSTFTESSPMDCHSSSPSPVSQPDSSSAIFSPRFNVHSHLPYENMNRLVCKQPDSSVQSTNVGLSKLTYCPVRNESPLSNRLGPLNLTSDTNRNEFGHAHDRDVFVRLHDSPQSNFLKTSVTKDKVNLSDSLQTNFLRTSVKEEEVNAPHEDRQRPLEMHNIKQEDSECVWRPW